MDKIYACQDVAVLFCAALFLWETNQKLSEKYEQICRHDQSTNRQPRAVFVVGVQVGLLGVSNMSITVTHTLFSH